MDQPDEDDLLRALNDWTAAAGPVQQPWSLYNAKGLMLAEPNLAYQVLGIKQVRRPIPYPTITPPKNVSDRFRLVGDPPPVGVPRETTGPREAGFTGDADRPAANMPHAVPSSDKRFISIVMISDTHGLHRNFAGYEVSPGNVSWGEVPIRPFLYSSDEDSIVPPPPPHEGGPPPTGGPRRLSAPTDPSERPIVPYGDIFIHAGDYSDKGQPAQTKSFCEFLKQLPHPHKIVIAGNHDITAEREFFAREDVRTRFGFGPIVPTVQAANQLRTHCFRVIFSAQELYGEKMIAMVVVGRAGSRRREGTGLCKQEYKNLGGEVNLVEAMSRRGQFLCRKKSPGKKHGCP